MRLIKNKILDLIGHETYIHLYSLKSRPRVFLSFINNFFIDAILFYKHSNVFKKTSYKKIEALIILRYHSIEKGLLHNPIRYKFGKDTVITLIILLKKNKVQKNKNKSQIISAYLALCSYYELHLNNNIDISDYFSVDNYEIFKKLLSVENSKYKSTVNHNLKSYFGSNQNSFFEFSNSRKSIRNYTGELIANDIIYKAIDLAKNAPSVCNRQPVKVYLVENKNLVNKILKLQGGLNGYDNISQLLIVTSDRSYFYTVGERNQLYIDGGIFLMNLLYALHFNEIAACPANWGMTSEKDIELKKLIKLPPSEKVISLVSIGIPIDSFKSCLSLRRTTDEILKIVK